MKNAAFIAAFAAIVGLGAHADAQTEEVAPEALRKEALTETATTVPDGWKVTAKISGTFNVTDAQNVVGANEGTAYQIGLNLVAEAHYKKGQHTVDTVLTIREAFQRNPVPDGQVDPGFIKSLDNLNLLSTYVYRFSDPSWLGPFARFKLDTQLINSNTTPTTDYILERRFLDQDRPNEVTEREATGSGFSVTEPFEPLLLRQVGGIFAQPFDEDVFGLDVKFGVGAQETIARGGFALVSTETAENSAGETVPLFILQELETIVDVGVELTAEAKGYVLKDVLTWNAQVITFLPAISSTDVIDPDTGDELSSFERLNLEFTGGLSLKLTKYFSAEYNLLVRRFPQVLNDFQIQNNLLLTLTVDVI